MMITFSIEVKVFINYINNSYYQININFSNLRIFIFISIIIKKFIFLIFKIK